MTGAAARPPSRRLATLFPHRLAAWRRMGLSHRAATAVALAGCQTPGEVAALGRAHFENTPNCSKETLRELEALAGWPPKRRAAVDAIAGALSMAMGPDEAKEAATDAVIALRRCGFVIVARRTEVRNA